MTTEIQAYTDSDLAYRIVLLKTLNDLVTREFREAKALAAEQYPKGASIPARTDTDLKLGRVTKSDPKPSATVVDEDAFEAWIRAEHPEKLEHRVQLTDLGEVLALLIAQDRKDLIAESFEVPDWLRTNALAQAIKGTQVPGVVVARPDGVVSATREYAAVVLVQQLLAGARVPLIRGIEA